ncbi:septum site-determining protein MinC [Sporomusa acidovorans]|uniref:Probable septum site-determining protein MinC n=1 Tax=Sporomusa acidovorans (strain ATCC 49682 / DSM 3132 / Mol) TaxID=1123286 RepID=A0ABZ3J0R3_SPOA4|nr:septum site-determining protein MinC [Sporomusa acidovorans]OZC22511.1 septum site-determining protein MinC [Sporomusa acidovorans DSM 3132]SDE73225.1 septum site-determining protein MinC [Sporomusa acidovorans]
MREDVLFKGSKGGLELVINQSADFTAILEQLKDKLESAAHFFTGNSGVRVISGTNKLTGDERRQLINLLADYGLALHEHPDSNSLLPEFVQTKDIRVGDSPIEYFQEAEGGQTLIVSRMLRSGQKVVFNGSVIIMGDVNPGAEVIASGNIVVQGTCRGVAHAGVNGDQTATITADKLMAGQLRIAGLIARAPDHQDEPMCREIARIANGIVIIEPA